MNLTLWTTLWCIVMLVVCTLLYRRSPEPFHLAKLKVYTFGITSPLISLLFDFGQVNHCWNSVCSLQTTAEWYSNICAILGHFREDHGEVGSLSLSSASWDEFLHRVSARCMWMNPCPTDVIRSRIIGAFQEESAPCFVFVFKSVS